MVAVSTYGGHSYCRDEWIKNTLELTKGHDVYILWNGPGNPRKTFPKHWTVDTVKTDGMTGQEILVTKNRKQRRYFLNRKYTHFFSLESDTFPPPGTIEKFLRHDKPIISALYFIRTTHRQIARIEPTQKNLEKFGSAMCGKDIRLVKNDRIPSVWGMTNAHDFKHSLNISGMDTNEAIEAQSLFRLWRIEDCFPQRGLVRVFASGIGSALIQREVLEQINFKLDDEDDHNFTDYMLYKEANLKGFNCYVDTDTIANHIHPLDEDGGDLDKWFGTKDGHFHGNEPASHKFA